MLIHLNSLIIPINQLINTNLLLIIILIGLISQNTIYCEEQQIVNVPQVANLFPNSRPTTDIRAWSNSVGLWGKRKRSLINYYNQNDAQKQYFEVKI